MSSTTPVERWLCVEQLYDGTGTDPVRDRAVGIRGTEIVAVTSIEDLPSDAEVEHLPGATLVPGLVDAHVHLLFSCDVDHERTRHRFETSDDAALTAIGVRNAAESLLGGVTTVRDCGDTRGIVGRIRDSVATGWTLGPTILTAGAPLTTPQGHLHWCGNGLAGPDQIAASIERLADNGADLVKIMTSGGTMTRESDPLSAQFGDAEVELAVRTAHARGLPVAAHAQNVASIRGAVHAGVDTIEHCLWRDGEGQPAEPQDLVRLLVGSSSTVVLTLAGIQRALVDGAVGFSDQERADAVAASPTGDLVRDFAWARQLREAGIAVVVGSDAGVRFTGFRDFADSVHCATVALDCSLGEAIAMTTSLAAEAIGQGDRVGRIAPGMQADLVVLDGTSEQRLGAVRQVIRSGRTVVRDGALVMPRPTALH
ncbi:MAG TPA: amidohydrolase family protein [Candidatus Avipropionibacterium avicola]|uniref:Amidohydrolase family protein n=1 Tax=Candidatus Avipropionibacterium avicola TaxID=2840701 RepID=A0A9D1GV41_9ACTN|nr:amidohydrolase family protein [Candidatus Avipropionibacterium avicola]